MEQPMSCFKWQNHASDYLDGTLPESTKHEFDEHLAKCKACNERHKHYGLILSTIANQPKALAPTPSKKAPFSKGIPQMRWETIPWYIRPFLEGACIVFFVLVGISSAPRIRAFYERSMDKNLNDFRESSIPTEVALDRAESNIPPLQTPLATETSKEASRDDISGENDDDEEETPRSVASQLWRFTLKTVSPDELRPQIVKVLTSQGIPSNAPGLGGIQVPGGIEFDFVLPETVVPHIKQALAHLVAPAEGTPQTGPDNFSWYKIKSKRKLPSGSSQVVIWLSQPN